MIIVHHLNQSRSHRVLWLLEELGLAYDIRHYTRDPNTLRAPPELRQVHPLGKAPVLQDGELVLAESGAIIEYLVERYGQGELVPEPAMPERILYSYWLHFAEGSAMPPLLLKLVFARMPEAPMPWFVRPLARRFAKAASAAVAEPDIARNLDHMEQALSQTRWFAGHDFSAADIQMSFPIEASAARGGLDARHPNLQTFLTRIRSRGAYQRAVERGGAQDLLR